MAQDSSFDIVSEVNAQLIDDAVNVAMKEISNRFDFKGIDVKILFNKNEDKIEFSAPSDMKLQQIKDILFQKMAKKSIDIKSILQSKRDSSANGAVREYYTLVNGIDKEIAKNISKDIRDSGIKVQSSIIENKIRVSGKNKDDLQNVIQLLRGKDYTIPLQFSNYR